MGPHKVGVLLEPRHKHIAIVTGPHVSYQMQAAAQLFDPLFEAVIVCLEGRSLSVTMLYPCIYASIGGLRIFEMSIIHLR